VCAGPSPVQTSALPLSGLVAASVFHSAEAAVRTQDRCSGVGEVWVALLEAARVSDVSRSSDRNLRIASMGPTGVLWMGRRV
jgi:hypothetical protein